MSTFILFGFCNKSTFVVLYVVPCAISLLPRKILSTVIRPPVSIKECEKRSSFIRRRRAMAPQACLLTPTPADPICDFKAQSVGSVTLEVKGTTGSALFNKAAYNGTAISLPVPAPTIMFNVVSGNTNLDVVYVFSDPANGAGTLNEVCSANTKLKDVQASVTSARYVICAP